MLRQAVAVAVGLVALTGAAPVVAEEPASPPLVVPADRLPVLGTVGDYPPESDRVVVELFPGSPPRIVVDGTQLDLHTFHTFIEARGMGMRDAARKEPSRLHLVVRADRSVLWRDVQWVLQSVAKDSIGVCRVLFAARPEDGSEEGAMALFLPVDVGAPLEGSSETAPVTAPVELDAGVEGPLDPGPSLEARIVSLIASLGGSRVTANISARGEVETGQVLRCADSLMRGGVQAIVLRGTTASPRERGQPGAASPHASRPAVVVLGEALREIAPAERKPLARVRGALAGQATVPELASAPGASVVVEQDPFKSPGDEPRAFGGRRGGHRDLKGGPTQETEEAVFRGLEWLKNHQSPDGSWNSDGFEAACGDAKCGGSGGPLYDVGVTGLATLAFLGYGETHKTPRYGHVVRNALKYLKGIQDAEGCFGPRASPHFSYNHAIATVAMAEAYGLTQSPLFKSTAQNGVNFILQCRNPGLAWRYGVRPQDNDTSITGWMVMALKSAKSAGLEVPDEAFRGAVAWLDKVTDPETGRAGYTQIGNGPARSQELIEQFPAGKTESLTAIAVLSRIFSGAKQDDPMVRKGTALCLAVLPKHDDAGNVDFTYWHFGTLAMFQVSGDAWKQWHDAMKAALVLSQRKDEGHARGSWDPKDPWAGEGGRIYSTALAVLCLEVYYRYARVFGEPK